MNYKPFSIQAKAHNLVAFVETSLKRDTRITVADWDMIAPDLNTHFSRDDRADVWAKRYYKAWQVVGDAKPPKQQPPSMEECLDPGGEPIPYIVTAQTVLPHNHEADWQKAKQTELTYELDRGHCPECRYVENNGKLWCCKYPKSILIKSAKHWCGQFERK